jgi:hypothetical protein|tara:strand:- start:238 stop:513 length:276 start_codon:yes stop_codon:yes gene_type:complete
MEKYLKIPASSRTQLVSCSNVAHVYSASATATSTRVDYTDGTTATIAHAAAVAFDVRDALSNAIIAARQTSWTQVEFLVDMPKVASAITLA